MAGDARDTIVVERAILKLRVVRECTGKQCCGVMTRFTMPREGNVFLLCYIFYIFLVKGLTESIGVGGLPPLRVTSIVPSVPP